MTPSLQKLNLKDQGEIAVVDAPPSGRPRDFGTLGTSGR